MTILQKAPTEHTERRPTRQKGRPKFGQAHQAVRRTDAWKHETFAEEQARWERDDSEYARICEQVRQAKKNGEQASRRADQAKAEWDARVFTRRQANDDAQKAHHAPRTAQTTYDQTPNGKPGDRFVYSDGGAIPSSALAHHTTRRARRGDPRARKVSSSVESNRSPAPGMIPESASVHA